MTETEIQRFKGLLAGWENLSNAFKKKGDHASVELIDRCLTDLKVLLTITENLSITKNSKGELAASDLYEVGVTEFMKYN